MVAPKTFIGNHNAATDENVKDSLRFAAISLILADLLTPKLMLPAGDLWTILCLRLVVNVLALVLGAVAILAAWRILGQRAPFSQHLITYVYYSIPAILIIVLFNAVGFGILYAYDPQGAAQYIEINRFPANPFSFQSQKGLSAIFARARIPFIAMTVIGNLGLCASLLWMFLSWGAFRNIFGATRRRSFFVSLLAFMLVFPLGVAFLFLMKSLDLL